MKEEFDKLTSALRSWLETRVEILRLELIRTLAAGTAASAVKGILTALTGLALLFLNVSLALYVGEETGRYSLGALAGAGSYIFLLILFRYALMKPVREKITNVIIHELAGEKEDH